MARDLYSNLFQLTSQAALQQNAAYSAVSNPISFDSLGDFQEERQRIQRKLEALKEAAPKPDFTDFSNHVYFDSAMSKFDIAKTKVLNDYPYNGDSEDHDVFELSCSLYENYVAEEWPKYVGSIFCSGGSYVSASDYSGNLYLAQSSSLYIAARVAPALPGVTNNILSVLSGSSLGHQYGYTLTTTDTIATFTVVSGGTQYTHQAYFTTSSIVNNFATLGVIYDVGQQNISMWLGASKKSTTSFSNMTAIPQFGPATVIVGQNFTGSLGEIRIMHTASEAYHVKTYNSPITSEDFVKLNYRFNEGVTGIAPIDATVIDYSQSKLHGKLINATATSRRSGSTSPDDPGDLILYPFQPDVMAFTASQETAAEIYDATNRTYIFRLLPEDLIVDDQNSQGILTSFSLAMARYFDELKMYLDQFDNLRVTNYGDTNESPDLMLPIMKKYFGWKVTDHFSDSNPLQFLFGENILPTGSLDVPLIEIKDQFWRRILNNLPYLYKTKGKRYNLDSFFNVLGINPNLINLKEYGSVYASTIDDDWLSKEKEISCLNILGSGLLQTQGFSGSQSGMTLEFFHTPSPLANKVSDIFQAYQVAPSYADVLSIPTPLSGVTYSLGFAGGANTSFKAGSPVQTTQQILSNLIFSASNNYGPYIQNVSLSGTGNSASILINWSGLTVPYAANHISVNSTQWAFSTAVKYYPPQTGSAGSIVLSTAAAADVVIKNPPVFNNEPVHFSIACAPGSVTYGVRQFNNGAFYSTSSLVHTGMSYAAQTGYSTDLGPNVYASGAFFEFRIWSRPLSASDLDAHAYNPDNIAENYFLQNQGSSLIGRYPLGQNFSDLTQNLSDLQQSIPVVPPSGFGSFLLDYGYLSPTFDLKWTQNKIRIRNKSTLAVSDLANDTNQVALEFNLVDALNEDISKIFSTFDSMNNIIGSPVNKYRDEYHELENYRNLYFQRLTDSLNFTRFFKLFRWFDKKLATSIKQLLPARADFIGGEFVVESHMLERNKYQYLYPVFHTPKTIGDGNVSRLGNTAGSNQIYLTGSHAVQGTYVRSKAEKKQLYRDQSVEIDATLSPRFIEVSKNDAVQTWQNPYRQLSGFSVTNSDSQAIESSTNSANYREEYVRRIDQRKNAEANGRVIDPSISSGLWLADGHVFGNVDSDDSETHYHGVKKHIGLSILACAGASLSTANFSYTGNGVIFYPNTFVVDQNNVLQGPSLANNFLDYNVATEKIGAVLSFCVSASSTQANAGLKASDFTVQWADGNSLAWPSITYPPSVSGNLTRPYGNLIPLSNQPGWYQFTLNLNQSLNTQIRLADMVGDVAHTGWAVTLNAGATNTYAFKNMCINFQQPLSDAGVRYYSKMDNQNNKSIMNYQNDSVLKQASTIMPSGAFFAWSDVVPNSSNLMYFPRFGKSNAAYSLAADNSAFSVSQNDTYSIARSTPIPVSSNLNNIGYNSWAMDLVTEQTVFLAGAKSINSGSNTTIYYGASLDGGRTFGEFYFGNSGVGSDAVADIACYTNPSTASNRYTVYFLLKSGQLRRSDFTDFFNNTSVYTVSSGYSSSNKLYVNQSNGDVYLAGTDSSVYRSTDGGFDFTKIFSSSMGSLVPYDQSPVVADSKGNVYIGAVSPSSANQPILFSSSTGTANTFGNKAIFPSQPGAFPASFLGVDSFGNLYYTLGIALQPTPWIVMYSEDHGATWSAIDYVFGVTNPYIEGLTVSPSNLVVTYGYYGNPNVLNNYANHTRFAQRQTNASIYGPRSLSVSTQYYNGQISGSSQFKYLLGNVAEFPHYGGLFQMKNMVLGTQDHGRIGTTDDSIVQINHVGSVVNVLWPDQSTLDAPVPGFGELSIGQSPGKATTSFTFGTSFDTTAYDHVSLYCYALKQSSGSLEDVQVQIQRRPLSSVGFATDQSVEYGPSGSFTEARYRDILHTKQIDYGDLTQTAISWVIDVPLINVREIRIGVRQKFGQVDSNQNLLVWGRFIDSKVET